jgi:hypothetical protein
MTGVRFTAYLSSAERDELARRARANDTSANAVLRTVLRAAFGFELPAWAAPLLEKPREEVAP